MRRVVLSALLLCVVAALAACGGASHRTATTTTARKPAPADAEADAEAAYRHQAYSALTKIAGEMQPLKTIPAHPDPDVLTLIVADQSDAFADGVARLKNIHPPARYRGLHRAATHAIAWQYGAYIRCLDPLSAVGKRPHPTDAAIRAAVRACFAPIAAHGARDTRAIEALLRAVRPPTGRPA